VPHLRVVGRSYFTNKVPAGAFRSLGRAQTIWGYESHYDTIARQLGIELVAFRLHNFLHRGQRLMETVGPFDVDMDDLVRRSLAAVDWDGCSQRVGPHADVVYSGTTPVRGRGIAATFRCRQAWAAPTCVPRVLSAPPWVWQWQRPSATAALPTCGWP
jgi:xanthine dehydrogenase molybdopterin-binding subunit B